MFFCFFLSFFVSSFSPVFLLPFLPLTSWTPTSDWNSRWFRKCWWSRFQRNRWPRIDASSPVMSLQCWMKKNSWTVVWTSFFWSFTSRSVLFVCLFCCDVMCSITCFLPFFWLYDVTPLLIGTQLLLVQLPLRTVCELLWPFGSMNFNLPPCFSFYSSALFNSRAW